MDVKQGIGLLLVPCSSSVDPTRQLYHTGLAGQDLAGFSASRRTILLEKLLANPHIYGRRIFPRWRDIYIADRPSVPPASLRSTPIPRNFSPPMSFHFPMQHLKTCLGHACSLIKVWRTEPNWAGSPPAVYECHLPSRGLKIYMIFGRCSPSGSLDTSPHTHALRPGTHWALVFFDKDKEDRSFDHKRLPRHNCSRDHVANWSNSRRAFTNGDSSRFSYGDHVVTLSFDQDPQSPHTLVPCIKYTYLGHSESPVHVRVGSLSDCHY